MANNPLPFDFVNNPDDIAAYKAYVAQSVATLQKGTAQDFLLGANPNPNGPATQTPLATTAGPIAVLDQMLSSLAISQ